MMWYAWCIVLGVAIGCSLMQLIYRGLRELVDVCCDAVTERNSLIAMLSRDYRKQNPDEPMPDWLAMSYGSDDYENGDGGRRTR